MTSLQFVQLQIHCSPNIRGNFVRLPPAICDTLDLTNLPIQCFNVCLEPGSGRSDTDIQQKKIYLGWDGFTSQSSNSIEINNIVAKTYNLQEDEFIDIIIRKLDENQIIEEALIEPCTSDDWEIIENNVPFLQDQIIYQTRVMTLNSVIICYVGDIVAKFQVKKISPENLDVGKISAGTMIIVEPKENEIRNQQFKKQSMINNDGEHDIIIKQKILRSLQWNIQDDCALEDDIVVWIDQNDDKILDCKYAFVSVLHNKLEIMKTKEKQKKLDFHDDRNEKPMSFNKKIIVKIKRFEKRKHTIMKDHILLSDSLWSILSLTPQNGVKLKVQFVKNRTIVQKHTFMNEKRINIYPIFSSNLSAKPNPESIARNTKFLMERLKASTLGKRTIFWEYKLLIELNLSKGTSTFFDFSNEPITSNSWILLNENYKKVQPPPTFRKELTNLKVPKIVGMDNTIDEIVKYLTIPILPSPGIIVEGRQGSGKTSLLLNIWKTLSSSPYPYYVKYIDCETITDVFSFDNMKTMLNECISSLYWHYPSILILDNADYLFTESLTDEQQQGKINNNNSISSKLTANLINIVDNISNKRPEAIRVIFGVKDKKAINTLFFDKHFIGKTWTLLPPNREKRLLLLEHLFKLRNESMGEDFNMSLHTDLNLNDMSLEIEGYSILDIEKLIDKLFYEVQISSRNNNESSTDLLITNNAFIKCLKVFVPSSLQNVSLTKDTGVRWSDIGGLKNVKRLLLETLEWPTKYSPIFKRCPLRLRSGILLYGYPGCGKTLLASAIAQQCGLNFISVKGPEILNKYIGASEQNVRELFERAQSVQPCILFFDEFDSIAPKRGHDSTGVTDRVVNQLLTQMDGAEGLEGVYILAATSRPDLIDPALLRPGRLDKSVLCNIPNEEDRYDIMCSITGDETSNNELKLKNDTDLKAVVQATVGYSGADLQGLCYNAYLKAVHRYLSQESEPSQMKKRMNKNAGHINLIFNLINENVTLANKDILDEINGELQGRLSKEKGTDQESNSNPIKKSSPNVLITLADLLDACQETKPSISLSELRKLRDIYNKFQTDRDGALPTGETSDEIGSRLSLM
ncbi:AAA family ATPase peroxin 1 NDAI_0D01440 [Naumovozyma dairenensis CBS 421]|uniref:Peroxisomal ATPase PEX1 n=1 Tax=Naumovozyma dairenensis (strain ATCC 10597 / BCRC 20456 / CBS 421 / NBRC 0211 / NRRL Y-12639) TaxID=1071378 RepID=G0W9J7_NAUDC|nr:hypothetical protein NDAI_0D01440 [Naumovozyma dairenensis CBS 421]CCD24458.1 hypothetical protein NDAI_0D01440 [Naumovozyma dairenensis CBS 421]